MRIVGKFLWLWLVMLRFAYSLYAHYCPSLKAVYLYFPFCPINVAEVIRTIIHSVLYHSVVCLVNTYLPS